jgi:cytochrome c oxidase cbb3-type subunit I
MSPITTTADKDALLRAGIDRSLRHPVMFFFTSGAAWLAVSIFLGMLASAKSHSPDFLPGYAWLSYGRIFPAHVNTMIYGWGMQGAFAVIIWLMARLSRKECTTAGVILTVGHVWNLAVAAGVIGILSGNGTGMHWMEFPPFVWPVLVACYFLILIWSFIQFRVRPEGHVYITQWYLLAAMLWFPWVFITCHTLLHCVPGHPVMASGINAWFRSSMIFLFFIPVALGTAYYLAPKVTGRPVHSYSLAQFGFWSLAVIAPWAGMQKLAGAPIPYFLPYLGAAATALLFVPLFAAAMNALRTMLDQPETLVASPALRFATAGMGSMMVLAITAVLIHLPGSTLRITQFTLAGYGFDMLALYGCFTLVLFGATYFIVPRISRREWLSRRLIKMHFLFSVYGTIFVAIVALFGGLLQGQGHEEWQMPWTSAAKWAVPYAWVITVSWGLILFSNIFFFLHLTFMWLRLGRRSSHPVLLVPDHAGHESPHGPEGYIDNVGSAHAH